MSSRLRSLFKFVSNKNLLFVPAAVMNKVFDLFILDVYLNTLWEKRQWKVGSLDGNDKENWQSREKESSPSLRRAMAHENTALFHLNRRHTTQHDHTLHFAHKLRERKTFDVLFSQLPTTIWNLVTFTWVQWGNKVLWLQLRVHFHSLKPSDWLDPVKIWAESSSD